MSTFTENEADLPIHTLLRLLVFPVLFYFRTQRNTNSEKSLLAVWCLSRLELSPQPSPIPTSLHTAICCNALSPNRWIATPLEDGVSSKSVQ
jgi:hypothetical protein